VECPLHYAAAHKKQHLTIQVHLECVPYPDPRTRSLCLAKNTERHRADNSISPDPFPPLKGNDRVPRFVAEEAVDAVTIEIAEGGQSPLHSHDFRTTAAVLDIEASGRSGCR
jgi:hypothetical protein